MTDAQKYTSKLVDARTLVIGGTSGIGFCIGMLHHPPVYTTLTHMPAENLLENGAHVIVASSRQESVDKTLKRLQTSYPNASKTNLQGFTVDMGSEDSIKALLQSATNGGKDLLDHISDTSGDSRKFVSLQDLTPDDIVKAQRVRFNGPIFLAKHAIGLMKKAASSSITLTGGINSHQPGQGWYLSASVVSAKEGLMRGLAVDFRPVRVNLVAPGAVDTELFAKMASGERLAAIKKSYGEQSLVGGMGKPEDVAEAYVYCMRDRFVTGQVILSEGGLLLAPGARR